MTLRDIVSWDGADLGVAESDAPRAGNILATQLKSLEYAPDLGVDKEFFLTSDLNIPNDSFKTYCVNRLMQHRVNVVSVIETVHAFYRKMTVTVGRPEETRGIGL